MSAGPRPIPIQDRFWLMVEKTDSCWLWTGCKNGDGYGSVLIKRQAAGAHRVAYELLVGEIPEGLQLDHTCGTPACVNPTHLEPVTQAENKRRAAARRTHCRNGHPYEPENLYWYSGRRYCRTCIRIRKKRERADPEWRSRMAAYHSEYMKRRRREAKA